MVGRIARKEFTEYVRDGRFRVLGALVLAVAVAALAAGWRQYSDVQRQHAKAQAATRAQWLQQGNKNPHSAAHYGVYAFKPKSRLALFDTGVDSYVGVAAWLEAHKQNEFKSPPRAGSHRTPALRRAHGRVDFADPGAALHRADDVQCVLR
ncbi:MAG: hypothetical protein QM736_15780 [Vicinamibacterales bacterium]